MTPKITSSASQIVARCRDENSPLLRSTKLVWCVTDPATGPPKRLRLRGYLPYGYVALNGARLHDRDVDDYNRIQEEIDSKTLGGFPVSDWLLDWSCRKFKEAAGLI